MLLLAGLSHVAIADGGSQQHNCAAVATTGTWQLSPISGQQETACKQKHASEGQYYVCGFPTFMVEFL